MVVAFLPRPLFYPTNASRSSKICTWNVWRQLPRLRFACLKSGYGNDALAGVLASHCTAPYRSHSHPNARALTQIVAEAVHHARKSLLPRQLAPCARFLSALLANTSLPPSLHTMRCHRRLPVGVRVWIRVWPKQGLAFLAAPTTRT
jgi:hypothetical protein